MSLAARVALGVCVVLIVFIAGAALALERAFEDSARSALQERLLGYTFLLMAAAEVDPQGRLSIPPSLPEARFSVPGSGLYGQIADGEGKIIWQSESSLGVDARLAATLAAGERAFRELRDSQGRRYLMASFGIRWAGENAVYRFTFNAAEELSGLFTQVARFRRTLWTWLGAMALLLLIAQMAVLRWGLKPLRAVATEISAVEAGRQERLHGHYPKELEPLTQGLNELLRHEHGQQKRYRDALADLAHSLKTPLAVLRGLPNDQQERRETTETLAEQVARMDHIVRYQLQRAATTGWAGLGAPLALRPLLTKLMGTLQKVYADKAVRVDVELPDDLSLRVDEGDLLELMGNVLDNAYKWCRTRIRIDATRDARRTTIRVGDDGPGVNPELAQRILQRGVRADEHVPGHGLGLAIVRDILQAYEGEIEIGASALRGAEVRLSFPER